MGKQEISNTNNVEKWSSQAFFFSFFLFYFLGVEVRVREERTVFEGAGRGGMECPYQGPCKTFLQIDIYSWCSLMKVNYWKIFYLFCHMYSSVVQKLICKKHSPESSTKAISYCDATIYVQWCRVVSLSLNWLHICLFHLRKPLIKAVWMWINFGIFHLFRYLVVLFFSVSSLYPPPLTHGKWQASSFIACTVLLAAL